ncbi:nuclease [Sphingobium sp. C100]|uniref:thermonuclease family protein n=1 Tax=Sphingobium sp. C100 TaxID=1207055 RepID=UPI0003D64B6F|nr:thermonuclease family protein [Sphingobium sp. C100]ETI64280.1 nuclease [Sphingobium sp. C100]
MTSLLLALAMQAAFSGMTQVVDGDTLVVRGEKVRLSGVDAPELAQLCGPRRDHACGKMAASWLKARVEGKRLVCTPIQRDRYGRLVAVCRLNGRDIGADLVEAGWATAYRRYSLTYVPAETRARAARRGIWAHGLQRPEAYRRTQRGPDPAPPNASCGIKGNIAASGARIYHLPGSRTYADVRIDTSKGERWFCSAAQARRAGWRPVRAP